jgi:hypothetical protein
MKTRLINTMLFVFLSIGSLFAQNVTTVRANSNDISDNLDLQAVASIFGDSRDLEDFERRLNDPDMMISNLDLNNDGRVDYLRVVELAEQNTHVIVLQSVLGPDMFQDVATIEVERDRQNNVTVQVVGDPYIYGPSYIYQPVYVTRPVVFGLFWGSNYRPYYSPWYWDYYPTYYNYWAPCAPYRYHNHVNVYINYRNTYTYVNVRHSNRAMTLYNPRRSNAYERENPNRSFAVRNNNVRNHYELQQNRGNVTPGGRANNTRNYNGNTSTRGTLTNGSNNGGGRTFNNGGRENGTRSINQTGERSFNQGNTRNSTMSPSRSINNTTAPSRSFENNNSSITPSRSYTAPRINNNQYTGGRSSNQAVRSNPTPQYQQPSRSFDNGSVRQNNTPRTINNSTPSRSNMPTMQSAPQQVRSNTAPVRQAPAQMEQRSNNGGGRRG